ncbi:Fe-S cluster assembly protein IscA [Candidatus Profftella armatura (Diaphorina cf. continua)]|uniref:Fe-S cluster assembly protein IscA n=1 Tax=Candidatus Profftella armatura (Diaphorina cf. continua) TaxID=2661583 RepID=A0A7R6VYM8_9PROT|nr:iron-sulfur cluster assembly accessory protein [Candidatus Profftella armatura (Diaphorina cf. continua)]BCG49424.1 Fe-S cluster assembly protein IscA [Candidatus Profftella armatura (Diaphorina cf. continua)]
MEIKVTKKAVKYINKYIQKRGKGIGLRLGVYNSGCSGLSYKLEYVDEPKKEDKIFKLNGIKIFINKKDFLYLNGIELDFEFDGLNKGFKFKNPNIKNKCGCGKSFQI